MNRRYHHRWLELTGIRCWALYQGSTVNSLESIVLSSGGPEMANACCFQNADGLSAEAFVPFCWAPQFLGMDGWITVVAAS